MSRVHFNRSANSWDEMAAERDKTKLEQMVGRLDIKTGSTVLDVGSGTGVFLPFLLNKTGRNGQIVALDYAEEMLKIACSKVFSQNIDCLCADITNIPLGEEIFDVIVCYSCFPHFQDKTKALAEMNRITKSGGKLFICHTTSRDEINGMHRAIPAVEKDTIPDRDEMQEMLSVAGFTDIQIDDSSQSYLAGARKP